MKSKILFLICICLVNYTYAQTDFFTFVKNIDWQANESNFVYKFHSYVTPLSEQDVWEEEGTECNYSLKGISVNGIKIEESYLRVRRDNKQLFRIIFIALDNETDLSKKVKLEESLIKQLGTPIKTGNDLLWIYDKYKINATILDLSSVVTNEIEKYMYAIKVEPIQTYYVNYSAAKIESNNANKKTPNIEYFRIDNDRNIYIKEKEKDVIIKRVTKVFPSPKGEILSYDDGMFYYRKDSYDIVYIEQGLAVTYPIIK